VLLKRCYWYWEVSEQFSLPVWVVNLMVLRHRSFGVILALLSKARTRSIRTQTGILSVKPFITSLVIVPHRDLAYQFHHWIDHLVISSQTPGHAPPLLASIAQVIVRGGRHVHGLRNKQPFWQTHLTFLIGTPQALLELVNGGSVSHTQFQTISSVYVDEVDYLVESVPTNTTKWTRDKIKTAHGKASWCH